MILYCLYCFFGVISTYQGVSRQYRILPFFNIKFPASCCRKLKNSLEHKNSVLKPENIDETGKLRVQNSTDSTNFIIRAKGGEIMSQKLRKQLRKEVKRSLEQKRIELFETRKKTRRDDRRYAQLTETIESLTTKRTRKRLH